MITKLVPHTAITASAKRAWAGFSAGPVMARHVG
jgi:hypothetical protein